MSFWSSTKTPLGNELTNISENSATTRRSAVEGQVNTVITNVTTMLREFARTHRERKWSINVNHIFRTSTDGTTFTPTSTGTTFTAAMNGVTPAHPDNDEIIFYGNKLADHFSKQNLNAEFDTQTSMLSIDWTTLPTTSQPAATS